jgi:aminoglycoside phosphotransferase (APT) family kinase protein
VTAPNPDPPAPDPTALPCATVAGWLAGHGVAIEPPLTASLIQGGRSNLTYQIADASGARWVLRRPPLSGVIASAHDVLREHRIMAALAGTPAPVPRMVAACDDLDVLGVPFFVMDYVDGVVLRDQATAEAQLTEAARRGVGTSLVDALVALHGIDPATVGLAGLGRGSDYVSRQLARWERQLERLGIPEDDDMHDVLVRLQAGLPEQRDVTIVHGDFRPGNVIVGPDGQVRALLDWELATLGDPLADLGWLMAYWGAPADGLPMPEPTRAAGFGPRDRLGARYARLTGRSLEDLGFYLAFALWRRAAIIAGVNARARMGAYGTGSSVAVADDRVRRLAAAARAATQEAGR